MDTYYIEAAVPTPLPTGFDYALPAELMQAHRVCPGVRVRVPFGRQTLIAIVLAVKTQTDCPPKSIKAVQAVLDDQPLLPQSSLDLLCWASGYYHYPVGEVMANALPKFLRRGDPMALAQTPHYRLSEQGRLALAMGNKRSPKQHQLLVSIAEEAEAVSATTLRQRGFDSRVVKRVIEQQWLEQADRPNARVDVEPLRESGLDLSLEQQRAVTAINAAHSFDVFLLQGVTGSGKTEVYLQTIAACLQRGQHALVLVPEIGLTPQTVARFERRFAVPIVCLHSAMSDGERMQAWLKARLGQAAIVIGTRSALFVPMPRLGLIIIDEEHDSSFRQQSGFRYVARDLAIMRAKQLNIPVVLGSATPSLASLANAKRGRYHLLRMDHRVGGGQLPAWRVVDMRDQALVAGISQPLLARMQHHLEMGGQVLLFLNRRGFAPVLLCHHCGFSVSCRNCDAHMTLHHSPRQLCCHHCGARQRVPKLCPQCQQSDLVNVGHGTEQLEQAVAEHFADYVVMRMDRDNIRGKHGLDQALQKISNKSVDVLIGTQLLAKGHHFPALSLVGIIDVDSGLMSADFSALEHLGQTCLQVAGRAGREQLPGEVVLQTHQPDHPALQTLVEQGYDAFAERLLHEREQAGLPPFAYMAKWVVNAKHKTQAMAVAQQLKECGQAVLNPAVQFFGPMPALMERVNDRHYVELVCISTRRTVLQAFLSAMHQRVTKQRIPAHARWFVQVDAF